MMQQKKANANILNIDLLLIPHTAHSTFRRIAENKRVKEIAFLQEGIQLPEGMDAYRDAKMLLSNEHSFYYVGNLKEKNTMKYYNLEEKKLSLHLNSISLGRPNEVLIRYIK